MMLWLTLSRKNIYGPKDVRAFEVRMILGRVQGPDVQN